MNKFRKFLLIFIAGSTITSCGNNGNSVNTKLTPSWQLVGNNALFPVPNITFNSIAISSNGKLYVGGSADVNNGVVLANSATNGNWQLVGNNYTPANASGQVGALAVSPTNVVYAAVNMSYTSGTVVYSNSNESAGTWQQPAAFLFNSTLPDNGIINALAVDSSNTVYAATAAGSSVGNNNQLDYKGNIFRIQVESTSPPMQIGLGSAPDRGVMNSVLVANGTVYAAAGAYKISSDGSATYFGDVYSADSAGVHAWQQIGSSGTPDYGVANSIALSNDKTVIYVATSNGNVYKSSVASDSNWSAALGGGNVPDSSAINAIAVAKNGVIFAATALGNMYSVTGDGRWQQIAGSKVPDNWSINSIAIYGTRVYAATQGGHVYVVNFSQDFFN